MSSFASETKPTSSSPLPKKAPKPTPKKEEAKKEEAKKEEAKKEEAKKEETNTPSKKKEISAKSVRLACLKNCIKQYVDAYTAKHDDTEDGCITMELIKLGSGSKYHEDMKEMEKDMTPEEKKHSPVLQLSSYVIDRTKVAAFLKACENQDKNSTYIEVFFEIVAHMIYRDLELKSPKIISADHKMIGTVLKVYAQDGNAEKAELLDIDTVYITMSGNLLLGLSEAVKSIKKGLSFNRAKSPSPPSSSAARSSSPAKDDAAVAPKAAAAAKAPDAKAAAAPKGTTAKPTAAAAKAAAAAPKGATAKPAAAAAAKAAAAAAAKSGKTSTATNTEPKTKGDAEKKEASKKPESQEKKRKEAPAPEPASDDTKASKPAATGDKAKKAKTQAPDASASVPAATVFDFTKYWESMKDVVRNAVKEGSEAGLSALADVLRNPPTAPVQDRSTEIQKLTERIESQQSQIAALISTNQDIASRLIHVTGLAECAMKAAVKAANRVPRPLQEVVNLVESPPKSPELTSSSSPKETRGKEEEVKKADDDEEDSDMPTEADMNAAKKLQKEAAEPMETDAAVAAESQSPEVPTQEHN